MILTKVEKAAKGKPPEERLALRRELSRPVFDEMEAWLEKISHEVAPKTQTGKAVLYALH